MASPRAAADDPPVLIAVLKDRRDLRRLRRERWYRIPVRRGPRRPFAYLAFYQPEAFGRSGRRIRFYAPVLGRREALRRELLPDEADHPRADDRYWRYETGPLLPLPRPVRNRLPRRLTFVYTTLRRLFAARDLFGIFHTAPVEPIVGRALARAGLAPLREFTITGPRRARFRLDFAVPCRWGAVAVECDTEAWHDLPAQRRRDRRKDRHLAALGWTVIRLRETAILADPDACARRVLVASNKLGGPLAR